MFIDSGRGSGRFSGSRRNGIGGAYQLVYGAHLIATEVGRMLCHATLPLGLSARQ